MTVGLIRNKCSEISNSNIDKIYRMMIDNGATGAKISGAGGGGYMLAYCPGNSKYNLIRKMGKKDIKLNLSLSIFKVVKLGELINLDSAVILAGGWDEIGDLVKEFKTCSENKWQAFILILLKTL